MVKSNGLLSLALLFIVGFSSGCIPPTSGTETPEVSIGGVVRALEAGEQVELRLVTQHQETPVDETLIVDENTRFTFTSLAQGIPPIASPLPATYPEYRVTVVSHPEGKLCTLDKAYGYVSTKDINDVVVVCRAPKIAGLLDLVPDKNLAACINQRALDRGYDGPDGFTFLECDGVEIHDFTGIDFLTHLESLSLGNNNFSSVSISTNSLWSLSITDNPNLSSIDLSNLPELKRLTILQSDIASIDLTTLANLEYITVTGANLTEVDLSGNPLLKSLDLFQHNLTSIDLSSNPLLTNLNMPSNDLSSIDLSANTALDFIDLRSNELSAIDVSMLPALDWIDVSYNNISAIDLSNNPLLDRVLVNNNQLSSIDLSHIVSASSINVAYNQLTEIDISNLEEIIFLDLNDNLLTNLDGIDLPNIGRAPAQLFGTYGFNIKRNPLDQASEEFLEAYAEIQDVFIFFLFDNNYD